mgnify:CR=1 FL=1
MEPKIKHIIFLDVDGVCNSEDWYYRSRVLKETQDKGDFDFHAIELLNQLEGCEIVISSSWGNMADSPLKAHGLKLPIIGHIDHTPYYSANWICRGNCIEKYIEENLQLNNYEYVIFDDDTDMLLSQVDNFVHVDSKVGLQQSDIDKARKILQLYDNSN